MRIFFIPLIAIVESCFVEELARLPTRVLVDACSDLRVRDELEECFAPLIDARVSDECIICAVTTWADLDDLPEVISQRCDAGDYGACSQGVSIIRAKVRGSCEQGF